MDDPIRRIFLLKNQSSFRCPFTFGFGSENSPENNGQRFLSILSI